MRKRHAVLTCTYTNILDMPMYARHIQLGQKLTPFRKNQSIPLYKVISKLRVVSVISLVLISLAISMPSYGSSYSVDVLRVYAHSRLVSYKEFRCLDRVLVMESNYNYKSANGSHYGVGQMRSKYYKSKDPFTQIDMTIAYIHKRYVTMCAALTYHLKHGHY